MTRDATKLLVVFDDEAHDGARRRLIGAMAGDGVWLRERHWSRVRAEIDRRIGYETGVPASARDQDHSAERLAWIANALSDEAGLALAERRSVDEAKGIRAIPIAVEGRLTALACSGLRNL